MPDDIYFEMLDTSPNTFLLLSAISSQTRGQAIQEPAKKPFYKKLDTEDAKQLQTIMKP